MENHLLSFVLEYGEGRKYFCSSTVVQNPAPKVSESCPCQFAENSSKEERGGFGVCTCVLSLLEGVVATFCWYQVCVTLLSCLDHPYPPLVSQALGKEELAFGAENLKTNTVNFSRYVLHFPILSGVIVLDSKLL